MGHDMNLTIAHSIGKYGWMSVSANNLKADVTHTLILIQDRDYGMGKIQYYI